MCNTTNYYNLLYRSLEVGSQQFHQGGHEVSEIYLLTGSGVQDLLVAGGLASVGVRVHLALVGHQTEGQHRDS